MQKCGTPVIWDVQYSSPPKVARYCKKCSEKTEYVSSGQFRINANKKSLDIWLIYKCEFCNTTWNSTIYSRISPQQVGTAQLERFHRNDEVLAMQYAMNISLLQQNGAKIILPDFKVIGLKVSTTEPVCLNIRSQYPLPIKLSSILKKQLGVSWRELEQLYLSGRIKIHPTQDLFRCKLLQQIAVTIHNETIVTK